MELTNGANAVAYLTKYSFKPSKADSVGVQIQMEEDALSRDFQRHVQRLEQRILKDLRVYISARRIGVVEACWNLLKSRYVDIWPRLIDFTVYFPGQRTLLNNSTVFTFSSEPHHPYEIERNFPKHPQHADLDLPIWKIFISTRPFQEACSLAKIRYSVTLALLCIRLMK